MNHYIAANKETTHIYGMGPTVADAVSDAVDQSDFFHANPHGNPDDHFPVFPATQRLIDRVAKVGGGDDLCWHINEHGMADLDR